MKIKTEVKIGAIVLVTILLVIWGINFLKGKNILKQTNVYYTIFENVEGLSSSAPVSINGYKIGLVSDIYFKKGSFDEIIVSFSVDEKINIPLNSIVELHSANLLGTKELSILPSASNQAQNYGDTLISSVKADLLSSLSDEIDPLKFQIKSMLSNIDSILTGFNMVFDEQTQLKLKKSIDHLHASSELIHIQTESGDLKNILTQLSLFSEKLADNRNNMDAILSNFENISDSLVKSDFKQLIKSLNSSFYQGGKMMEKINEGEGTLGQLSENDSLYNNINLSIKNLNLLLEDLNENPERYVQFSVFGKKNKAEKDKK